LFATIGIFVVLFSVIGGFLIEGGNISIIFQPVEFLIIGGSAVGAFIIISTPQKFKTIVSSVKEVFFSKPYDTNDYKELLGLMQNLFRFIQKNGPIKLEQTLDDPENSKVFSNFSRFLQKKPQVEFLVDSLRVMINAKIPHYDLENLFDSEIEYFFHEHMKSSKLINYIADSLPGLGIIAAVLGIVLTMQHISDPPEVLGHSIGSALVGTFLGIFLCYGIVGPIAKKIEYNANEEKEFLYVIKVILICYASGLNSNITLEFGRRAIPLPIRPDFFEVETTLKEFKKIEKF